MKSIPLADRQKVFSREMAIVPGRHYQDVEKMFGFVFVEVDENDGLGPGMVTVVSDEDGFEFGMYELKLAMQGVVIFVSQETDDIQRDFLRALTMLNIGQDEVELVRRMAQKKAAKG